MEQQDPEVQKVNRSIQTLIDGDRLINFSDAVFAFSATLLVLKIDLPNLPPEVLQNNFWIEIIKLIPSYVANFVSFLIIAYYWRMHHKLFLLVRRFNILIVWMNIILLIFVAFLPFPIDLFGEYSNFPDVVVFFTLAVTFVGLILLVMWLYAAHKHRLIDKHMGEKVIEYHTLTFLVAPVVFGISIPLAYFDPFIAKISWVLVIVCLLLLNQIYKRNVYLKAEPE